MTVGKVRDSRHGHPRPIRRSSYSDFIRVSGWLIRQSNLARAKDEKALQHSSSYLGAGFFDTKPTHLHRTE